ncbi:response regulator [Winogradskyella schleiferi]|uniref:response regulator n=1 Tax=Winogradskyella schleiferi TaxID=2686078 RepID=UPI0015BDAB28|nr:response regulator [Winogradskyella schleiferi]
MNDLFQNTDAIKALITTFLFQGAFVFIGLYMLLVYIQVKKKDYLLYGIYSLLFAIYFFMKIDLMLELRLFTDNVDLELSFLLPLLFLLTGIYVKFINVFAEIKTFHLKFSKEIDLFTKLMYVLSATTFLYLLITKDSEILIKYQSLIFIPLHLYSIYAVIRAFMVIKSKLRYYILISNVFLIVLTIVGLYSASEAVYTQGVDAYNLFGFYGFNASQLGVFLEMLCLSLGLGYKFNLIEIEKDKIKKLDEFKTKLYNNISHEFKTPLTLISGPIDTQLAKPNISEDDKKQLNLIKRNSKRLINLVNQLLDLSKLESGNLKLTVPQGNLSVLLKQLVTAFDYKALEKNINFTFDIDVMKDVWFDSDVVEKIISNLLSNAVKYTPQNGSISFNANLNEGFLTISIINNGNHLKAEELPKLFQRYYQNSKYNEGVGIGLSLVKELAILSHGNIIAHTMNTDEIQFTVTLPLERAYFRTSEISEQPIFETILEEPIYSDKNIELTGLEHNQKPILLVVEDDKDIRSFIHSIFKDEYQISEACNGKEGMTKALKLIPDIIISDIMMPILDGIDMCNTLKNDVKTSHIPIILLTAKSGDKNEIKGLTSGADAYVTKPFNVEKLKIRVQQIIANRKALHNFYSKNNALDFHNLTVSNTDDQFFQNLKEAVKENILQPDFTSQQLSELMLMSRMQLHRKLKSLTGLSTTEFIKKERMKVAVTLLEKTDNTISEIAYQTGFNTSSYFIRTFKSIYNCTPTEYTLKASKHAS